MFCNPTKLANQLMRCLRLSNDRVLSPLDVNQADVPREEEEDYLETHNLLSVILRKHIPDTAKILDHPAMKPIIIEKCNFFVQTVRQELDNILSCSIERHATRQSA